MKMVFFVKIKEKRGVTMKEVVNISSVVKVFIRLLVT